MLLYAAIGAFGLLFLLTLAMLKDRFGIDVNRLVQARTEAAALETEKKADRA